MRVVKIDRTFVGGLGTRDRDRTIVRGIIELAHNLGLVVVAEGIETEAQYRELAALGCDHAQGYLFGAPQPAAELMLSEGRADPLTDAPSLISGCEASTAASRCPKSTRRPAPFRVDRRAHLPGWTSPSGCRRLPCR